LLAFSGFTNKDARVTSAIASNVWNAYEKLGNSLYSEDALNFLIINCENGRVIVTKVRMKINRDKGIHINYFLQVANLLLCLYANEEVGLGILKTKITKLKESLEQPLLSIS
jgi:ragulator complex protein LAMTOR2